MQILIEQGRGIPPLFFVLIDIKVLTRIKGYAIITSVVIYCFARVAELADAQDLKSCGK